MGSNKLREQPKEEKEKTNETPSQRRSHLLDALDVSKWLGYENMARNLPFIIFLASIGIFYIFNQYVAEKNQRNVDELQKNIQQLQWQYKSEKSAFEDSLMQSNLVTRVAQLGLIIPNEPPQPLRK
jgi:hypothetical protein